MFCFFGSMPSARQIVAKQIGNPGRSIVDQHPVLARLANDLPALDAATAEHNTPGVRIMVASLTRVDDWGPAKFTHPDDQRRFEQAAFFQIDHQRAPGRIESLAKIFHLVEIVVVRVPTGRA